jgi:anti-sigma factor RsiW
MDCRSVIHSLSDYVDGLLAQQESRLIESHLRECPPCQTIRDDLQQIRSAARELPLHAPPRALWARIQQEIAAQSSLPSRRAPVQSTGWWQRLSEKRFTFTLPQLAGASALAASLLIFAGVRSQLPTTQQSLVGTSAATSVAVTSPAVQSVQSRIQERLKQLNARRASWNPQVQETFEEHLRRLDESLDNTRRALQSNPDPDQQQMLLELYQEKLQVLEDFDKLR